MIYACKIFIKFFYNILLPKHELLIMIKHLKILLAEQDKDIASITKNYLVSRGYSILLCSNGEEALECFQKERLDFVLIDVDIPVINGYDLASEIRRRNEDIPMMFIGAVTRQSEILRAFKSGADDFITRPFSMEELGLRIEAINKRIKTNEKPQRIITFGGFTLDTLHHVLIINGRKKKLTNKELDLLYLFCEYANRVVERSLALKRVWNSENYFNARNMDVYVRRLRNMLCEDPSVKLENVHGVGYKLVIR